MTQASQAKDYDAARRAAEAAYAFRPDPILLLNLGGFHQKLGNTAQAIDHFQRFLQSGDPALTPALRSNIKGRLAQLRASVLVKAPVVEPVKTPVAEPVKPSLAEQERTAERRLGWRTAVGVPLAALGLTVIGLGAGALTVVEGSCSETRNSACIRTYEDPRPVGLSLLIPGVVAVGAGVVLFSLDLTRRRKPTLLSLR